MPSSTQDHLFFFFLMPPSVHKHTAIPEPLIVFQLPFFFFFPAIVVHCVKLSLADTGNTMCSVQKT